MYNFQMRSQELAYDENDCRYWKPVVKNASYAPSELAIVLVDMWDAHWAKGASMRAAELALRVDPVVRRARDDGIFIVHGPSDLMDFYTDSPARKRALDIEIVAPAKPVEIPDYPLATDQVGGGSDTRDELAPNTIVWTRQSPSIFIDEDRDIIAQEGDIVYSHFMKRGIKLAIYIGIHTNMCILHRSFAIKAMLRRGMDVALVRDLTDAMYDPARPPYVSHAEGTALVISFIEKFYCPTIGSDELTL
ncbi:MAG: cysteine hydrolase [Oscillospiraceae bacterium]|nr:cysteine hydrolase [Oscillospiraceae bacterium]